MMIRSLLCAVTLLVFVGCQDDLTAEKQTWENNKQAWAAKVEKLKKDQAALNEKVKTLVVAEGDADKAALDGSITNANAALAEAEKGLEAAKATMEKAIADGKKVPVQVALGTTKSAVDGVLGKADSLIVAASGAIDTLNTRMTEARAAADAAKAKADAWIAEVKKKGATLNPQVKFKEAELDIAQSKAELDGLVASLKSCAELKTELTVAAVSEAADLATKRAESLKAYLAANGVEAAVIGKTVGQTLKEGEDKVTVAVTTPCK
ncbi:MAG: hypothetical protein DI536_35195 [Archangium gephyra]|uniref:Uncharacterized protein n=1 Tax=Archangium gephyra TaxID=48 RepID=A0A2W5U570_9BACT|nr:MAG: hypothetical protein DI536_35195 [Archangium gephyra]